MLFSNRIQNIKSNERVLEIGPGSLPYPRADVFLEKKFDEKTAHKQRGLAEKIYYDKPIYYYDGTNFPFKDNEFDYVVCSHVIEHIPINELDKFISEIERVAPKGYIELPSVFYEYIFNFYVHELCANYRNNTLLILDKRQVSFSRINDAYYLLKKIGFKKTNNKLIAEFKNFFAIGFEWENKIPIKIVNDINALVTDEDIISIKKYFDNIEGSNINISLKEKIKIKTKEYIKRKIHHYSAKNWSNAFPKWYILDYKNLKKQELETKKRFNLEKKEFLPVLNEKTRITGFDRHYIYHVHWALRKLKDINPIIHYDISSSLNFSTALSLFCQVKFFDYHKVKVNLPNLEIGTADLQNLPFNSNSINSLSCMHVVEHIGLGRYGDDINYDGDLTAIKELKRVLNNGGTLLFVVPIGNPNIRFNAHRIYEYQQVLDYFSELKLKSFTLIPDNPNDGDLINNPHVSLIKKQNYGCGCFLFKK